MTDAQLLILKKCLLSQDVDPTEAISIVDAEMENNRLNRIVCPAIVHHGPGHQSETHCQLRGHPHSKHFAEYGAYGETIEWEGLNVYD